MITPASQMVTYNGQRMSMNQYWDRRDEANKSQRRAMDLIRTLADEYTGRNPYPRTDINIGQTAEDILAASEYREPQEPK